MRKLTPCSVIPGSFGSVYDQEKVAQSLQEKVGFQNCWHNSGSAQNPPRNFFRISTAGFQLILTGQLRRASNPVTRKSTEPKSPSCAGTSEVSNSTGRTQTETKPQVLSKPMLLHPVPSLNTSGTGSPAIQTSAVW